MRLLDKWWPDLRLRSKGLIMVAVPAAVTLLIACAAYILATSTVVQEEWVRRSLLIGQEIQRLKANATELSSEVRGYLITADISFARRARDTIASFDATRHKLEHLTSDNAPQTQRLSKIGAIQRSRVEIIYRS